MDKKVLFGGIVGAVATLAFVFALLLIVNSFFVNIPTLTPNIVIGLITLLLAPIAGGFLAGLISRSNPLQAGLIAGLIASLIVFVAWLVIAGFSLETSLSGLVVVFCWVVLARMASSFAQPGHKIKKN
jgi:hypothetical protein